MMKRLAIFAVVAIMLSGSASWAFDTESFITNNLVLDVDARYPGDDPNRWQAVVGGAKPAESALSEANGIPVDGFLVSDDSDDGMDDDGPYKPVYTEEAADTNTICFYRHAGEYLVGGGVARGYSTDLYYDFDDDVIIEAWVRVGPPDCIADPCGADCLDPIDQSSGFGIGPTGRMCIVSDAPAWDTGWTLAIRKQRENTFGIEHRMRDNWLHGSGADQAGQIEEMWTSAAGAEIFMPGSWMHIVLIYRYPLDYDPVAMTGAEDPLRWIGGDGKLIGKPGSGGMKSNPTYDPNNYPPPFPWVTSIWQEPNFIALPCEYAPWNRNIYAMACVGGRSGNSYGPSEDDGHYWSDSSNFDPFVGDIARVRIFNGEVPAADINDFISDLYAKGLPQKSNDPPCWSWACQPNGDYNNDGFITSTDVSGLITAWNAPSGTHDPCADFSHDGFITSTDVSLLIGGWNGGCP